MIITKSKFNKVIFKSTQENFNKERLTEGMVKSNTIREIHKKAEIEEWLKFFTEWKNGCPKSITIRCYPKGKPKNKMVEFTRRITDISRFKECWVISWNPCEGLVWG